MTYFTWKVRVTERTGDEETDLYAASHIECPQQPGLGDRNFFQVSHIGAGTGEIGPSFTAFPGHK